MIAGRRRWLLLTQYYAPEIGAPQVRLRALVSELRRHGAEVEVLTGFPNYPAGRVFDGYRGRLSMREEIDGIPVRRVWIYAATGKSAIRRLANYFSFTFSAAFAVLFGRRPELLFVESQPLSIGAVALLAKWFRGIPYVYNVPDLQVDVAKQMGFLSNPRLLALARGFENLCLRNAVTVSTVSDRFVEEIVARGIPRERISFLPNGADTRVLRPQEPAAPLLARWGLTGKKVFLYIGTLAYYHGLDTLIHAAERLRDHPDVLFLVIGDGPEKPRLVKLAADRGLTNVVFSESTDQERCGLYSIAYASVATLRNIPVAAGMRLAKIFPSLSCGVPVVFSGIGETGELLREHECGITVPPEDPEALAAAILELVRKPAARRELGERGRNWVVEHYGWDRLVERWLREVGWLEENRRAAVS